MPPENMQTHAGVHIPHPTRTVITPAHDAVPTHVQAAHALLMPFKSAKEPPALHIPDAHCSFARAGHRDRTPLQHLETAYENIRCAKVEENELVAIQDLCLKIMLGANCTTEQTTAEIWKGVEDSRSRMRCGINLTKVSFRVA